MEWRRSVLKTWVTRGLTLNIQIRSGVSCLILNLNPETEVLCYRKIVWVSDLLLPTSWLRVNEHRNLRKVTDCALTFYSTNHL